MLVPVLQSEMLWLLHNRYRRGINVLIMVLVPHDGLTELKAQGESLGLTVLLIERNQDLLEMAHEPR